MQHELGLEIVLVRVQMHTGEFAWITGAALTTAEPQQSKQHFQIGLPYSPHDLQGPAESQHMVNTWQCRLNPSMSKIPLRVLRNSTWLPRLINGRANRGAGCRQLSGLKVAEEEGFWGASIGLCQLRRLSE